MSHGRKMTPRGQMSRGANSGPAIMLMPPHIRATFMPNPPLKHLPAIKNKRKQVWTGMAQYMHLFESEPPPVRKTTPTPKALKKAKRDTKAKEQEELLKPQIEIYRKEQRKCGGEYAGMNCYNTLFVGRLAYEVTERKLLREMETFGPIKDIKIIKDHTTAASSKDGKDKSRGYAFIEYEHEEDMKRAYRAADGMRIEGRGIVADVERGHTVPTWLPRRLGGGLGGTRLGGKDKNVTYAGRFDPSRPEANRPPPMMMGGPGGPGGGPPPHHHGGMGRGGGPPPPHHGGGGGFDHHRGGPPPPRGGGGGYYGGGPPGPGGGGGYGRGGGGGDRFGGGGGGPPGGGRDWDRGRGGGGGDDRYGGAGSRKRHRSRSRSPESRRHSSGGGGGHGRRRY